jgi:hypothetical protein
MPAVTRPHRTDVEPPLGSARDSDAESAVHEFRIANASPSIENMEKLRFSSCFTPSAARWSTSAMLLRRRPVLPAESLRARDMLAPSVAERVQAEGGGRQADFSLSCAPGS